MSDHTVHPLNRFQALTARNMHRAMQQTAHATLHTECDVTALVEAIRQTPEAERIPLTTHVLYALTKALGEHPDLNAHLTEDELCVYDKVKLGLMVHAMQGVMVACIADAASLSLRTLEDAVDDLRHRARAGGLEVSDTRGATFMVANLGDYPIDAFTPILLPSAIAILGIGRVRPACLPTAQGCRPGHLLSLSLTFDHRGTTGIAVGHFLASLLDHLRQQGR